MFGIEIRKTAKFLDGSIKYYDACSENLYRNNAFYSENFYFIGIGTVYSIDNIIQTDSDNKEETKLFGFWIRKSSLQGGNETND
jgi:hypothetical protein